MSRLRVRLTYANVTATVALVLALGGGAYAAAKINSGDVKDNSLKSEDLKDDAGVEGVDVVDESLTPDDFGGELGGDIVARPIGTTEQTVTSTKTAYPLSENTWTQAADESDFFFGRLTFDPPATGPPFGSCEISAHVLLDGEEASINTSTADRTRHEALIPLESTFLFEPGSPESHTITVEVFEEANCVEPWVLTSVHMNVLGVR